MNVILQMEIARANRETEAKAEILESLKTALPWLEQAYCLMNSNRLDKRYNDLYKGVCDAMTACQDALDHIEDAPDQE